MKGAEDPLPMPRWAAPRPSDIDKPIELGSVVSRVVAVSGALATAATAGVSFRAAVLDEEELPAHGARPAIVADPILGTNPSVAGVEKYYGLATAPETGASSGGGAGGTAAEKGERAPPSLETPSREGVEPYYWIGVPELGRAGLAYDETGYVPGQKVSDEMRKLIETSKGTDKEIKKVYITSELSVESHNEIAYPTDRGLVLLAAYYEKKYGIPIIVAPSARAYEKALLGEGAPEGSKHWGIIATNGSGAGHVTPFLCCKTPEGKIQAVDLDSVGGSPVHASNNRDITWFKVTGKRQADVYSCRTDALVVLKDSLRDLRTRSIEDLSVVLPSTACKLPARWGKSVQISAALGEDVDDKVVSKRGESFREHRARFRLEAPRRDYYAFTTRHDLGEVQTVGSPVMINSYLLYKGKRNLNLIKSLVKDPEIMSIFQRKSALMRLRIRG